MYQKLVHWDISHYDIGKSLDSSAYINHELGCELFETDSIYTISFRPDSMWLTHKETRSHKAAMTVIYNLEIDTLEAQGRYSLTTKGKFRPVIFQNVLTPLDFNSLMLCGLIHNYEYNNHILSMSVKKLR